MLTFPLITIFLGVFLKKNIVFKFSQIYIIHLCEVLSNNFRILEIK